MRLGPRILGAIVIIAPFAMGASRIDIQMLFAGLIATVGVVHLLMRCGDKGYQPQFIWLLLIPCCATALQLMPMPMQWLKLLSPEGATLYLQSNPTRSWAPITVDYLATLAVLIHQLAFVLIVGILSSVKPRQCRSLGRMILAMGFVASLVAVIHFTTGMKQIYGVYDAIHRDSMQGFFGPFVNANTFSTLLLLAGFTGVGLTLDETENGRLKITIIAVLVCFLAAFLTGSRGVVPAAIAGWLIFVILMGASASTDATSLKNRLKAVVVFVGGGLCLAVSASLLLVKEWNIWSLSHVLDDPKVAVWSNAIDSADAYLMAGSGRGTFTHVFNQFQAKSVDGTVTHAENILIQHLIESGIVFGLITLGVAILIWGLNLRQFTRRPSGLAAGSLAALTAVGVYQLSDFGMSAMGLSLPTAMVLSMCIVSLGSSSSRRPIRREFTLISGALIIGLLTQFGPLVSLTGDQHLDKLKTLKNGSDIDAEASRLTKRHPADWLIPTIAAQRLLMADNSPLKTTLSWANRAQLLAPQNATPNLVSAHALYRAGLLTQSAGEYRRALEKSPWDELTLIPELIKNYHSLTDLLVAIPDNPRSQRRFVEALFRLNEIEKVEQLANELIRWKPNSRFGHLTRMRACLNQKNTDCLVTLAQWFNQAGDPHLAAAIDARRLLFLGQPQRALTLLNQAYDTGGKNNESFLRQALRTYRLLNATDRVADSLGALWTVSKSDPSKAFNILILKARFHQHQNRLERALISYDRALSLRTAVEYVIQAAQLEVRLSRWDSALKRVENALVEKPRNRRLKNLRDEIKLEEKRNRLGND